MPARFSPFLSIPLVSASIVFCCVSNTSYAQTYLNDSDTPQFVESVYFHNNSDSGSMTDLGYVDLRLSEGVPYASVELTDAVDRLPDTSVPCSCAGAQDTPSQTLAAYYHFEPAGFDGVHSGILFQHHQRALCTFPISRTAFFNIVTAHVDYQDCLYLEQIAPNLPRFRDIDRIRAKLKIKEEPSIGWPPGPLCLTCPPPIEIAPLMEKFSTLHNVNLKKQLPAVKKRMEQFERSLR